MLLIILLIRELCGNDDFLIYSDTGEKVVISTAHSVSCLTVPAGVIEFRGQTNGVSVTENCKSTLEEVIFQNWKSTCEAWKRLFLPMFEAKELSSSIYRPNDRK